MSKTTTLVSHYHTEQVLSIVILFDGLNFWVRGRPKIDTKKQKVWSKSTSSFEKQSTSPD